MSNNNNKNETLKKLSLILDQTKQDELAKLLAAQDELTTQKNTLQKEVKAKQSKLANLKHVYSHYRGTQKELDRLKTGGSKATYEAKGNKFWGDGSGTNEYHWQTKINNHYPTTYTYGANTYNYEHNLYQVTGKSYQITEEQAIKLLAKVVYEVAQIDKAKFSTKYTGGDKSTLESTIDHVKEQGQAIKTMNQKSGSDLTIKTYDLPQTYTQEQTGTTNTPYTNNPFQFAAVFTLLEKLNEDSLISAIEDKSQITQNESWKVLKSGETYTPEELKDYGLSPKTGTTLYKTGSDSQEIAIKNGLKGWLNLAQMVWGEEKNRAKIIASFTNSPQPQLFSDLRNQTTFRTHWELPETVDGAEKLLDELEEEKNTSTVLNSHLKAEIDTKQDEIKSKQTELTAKDTAIKKITEEILTKKRAELPKYNISKGFAKNNSEDNRRLITELYQIKWLLTDIRYLENDGDITQDSSNSDENTAWTQIEEILNQFGPYNNKCHLVGYFKGVLADKKDGSYDIPQAISRIKAGKYTGEDGQEENVRLFGDLADFYRHFELKETLVKLADWEVKAKTALDKAIKQEKKDEEQETLTDWQSKLKVVDPLLDNTVITQAIKDDWKTQNNFSGVAKVEKLLTKVLKDGKLDSKFAELIQKEDSEIKNLADLVKKKKAQEIITLIEYWDFMNKKSEAEQKEIKKKIGWDLKKKKDGKYTDDYEPTESELKEFVYQLAVGSKSLAAITKPVNSSNGNNNNNQTPSQPQEGFWRMDNPWLWVGGVGILALVGAGLWYFLFFRKGETGKSELEIETAPDEQ